MQPDGGANLGHLAYSVNVLPIELSRLLTYIPIYCKLNPDIISFWQQKYFKQVINRKCAVTTNHCCNRSTNKICSTLIPNGREI